MAQTAQSEMILPSLFGDPANPYQIKPFNFLLSCHVKPLGCPLGADPERFHLVGRYETDSRKWLSSDWIDQYSGRSYRITTTDHHGSRCTARVKTHGDVATEWTGAGGWRPSRESTESWREPDER